MGLLRHKMELLNIQGCLDEERTVLEEIRESMDFGYESFYPVNDCCRWEGVHCSPTSSHVIGIFFYHIKKVEDKDEDIWFPDMSLFSQLEELQELHLQGNRIGGLTNPEAICELICLQWLDLSVKTIEGVVPPCWSNTPLLLTLNLSKNRFQGNLTSFLSNLSKIEFIDVSHNRFEVQNLLLAGCNLNCQSGRIIPRFLSTQYNLETLDLSSNLLVGDFPTWMLHNVSSVLSLGGNSFVGEFPQRYKNNSTLTILDISDNHLAGYPPTNISLVLPQLYAFNASSNHFSGSIPPSLGELIYLETLDLSNNLLSGVVPVACLSKSSSLELQDVRHNQLSGAISNLPVFMQLGALLLGENQFIGHLTKQLCQMQMLQFLDFSKNKFSGNIPSCLNNNSYWRKQFQANSWVPIDFTTKGNSYLYQGIPLTLMTGIDFSVNTLAGSIPDEIGELADLRSLNLSQNLLTGHIPTSFKNLKILESLDLSYNSLTGQIPHGIVQLDSLTTFSVAFNNLSGRIPFNEHFSTFSESSFKGNRKLCGEQLQRKCSSNDNEDDGRQEKPKAEESLLDKPLFFYSFVFISYAVGFWSVIAPLYISVNWRRKYFATIDGWIEYIFDML
ncbi:hypothetical protein DITRI_Ditri08aG0074000 [Diplodiscus trichospermus]